jgi:PII-like signaling protein
MENTFEEKVLMRIFIGEGDRHGRLPLYESLMEAFRREGVAGATVLRGIAGFGGSHIYHTDKLLDISHDLPIVIEVVESREKLDALLPLVEAMMSGGRITLEKIIVRDIPPKAP